MQPYPIMAYKIDRYCIMFAHGGIYLSQPVLVSPPPCVTPSTRLFNSYPPSLPLPFPVPVSLSVSLPRSPVSTSIVPMSRTRQQPQQQQQQLQQQQQQQQQQVDGPVQFRKLFIGGLNHDTSDEQLRQFYGRYGPVVDCIVIRDPITKVSRGFGFVTFISIRMAESAMSDRPHTINGKVVDPKRAIPREEMPCQQYAPVFTNTSSADCRVLLSGLRWNWHSVDSLREHFDRFGPVVQVEMSANPKGAGLVIFESAQSVAKCLNAPGHIINDKKCDVTRSDDPPGKQSLTAKNGCPSLVGDPISEPSEAS